MSAPSKSRQRVSLACDLCRKRRRKCDGVEPGCGLCTRLNHSCNYSYDTDNRKPPSRAYMDSMKRKIAFLEKEVHRLQSADSVSLSSGGVGSFSDITNIEQDTGILQKLEPFGKLNVGEDGQLRIYGPRSSISYISDKLDVVTQPAELTQMNALKAASELNLISNMPFVLRDELLDLYFTFQNSSVMVVQQDVFLEDMKSYDNNGRKGRYFSVGLLYAMLSIGAQFYIKERPVGSPTLALQFYKLADYLVLQERECPTVVTVQACAILSMYNIFRDKEMLAWDYCGMAIRLSFGIGLSMKYDIWLQDGDLDPIEDQVRRVTWWGVYVLEKLVCNILGRPVAIKKYNITSTFPADDCLDDHAKWFSEYTKEFYPSTYAVMGEKPGRLLSTTTFMIELFMICDEPLNQLHLAFRPQPKSDLQRIIFDCHMELLEFERSLPNFLRLRPAKKGVILLPHVYMLHLRINYIQILLHRIFFIRENHGFTEIVKEDQYQQTCRLCANNIVRIMREYVTHYGVGTLDFMAAECVNAAAMVHLYLQRSTEHNEITSAAIHGFDFCLWLLHELSAYNFWAARLVRVLYVLAKDWGIDLH